MAVIGDEDTVTGFLLAGVGTHRRETARELPHRRRAHDGERDRGRVQGVHDAEGRHRGGAHHAGRGG